MACMEACWWMLLSLLLAMSGRCASSLLKPVLGYATLMYVSFAGSCRRNFSLTFTSCLSLPARVKAPKKRARSSKRNRGRTSSAKPSLSLTRPELPPKSSKSQPSASSPFVPATPRSKNRNQSLHTDTFGWSTTDSFGRKSPDILPSW